MISKALQLINSLAGLAENGRVDEDSPTYIKRLMDKRGNCSGNRATLITPAATNKDQENKSSRAELIHMCTASLCMTVAACVILKPFKDQAQGVFLALDYVKIPLINTKVSIFNILNMLAPAVGLFGAYMESRRVIKLFTGLMLMDLGLEAASFTYLLTAGGSLHLHHKETLLLISAGTIVTPSYYHLHSIYGIVSVVYMVGAPLKMLLRQCHMFSVAVHYESELEDQEYRRRQQ